MYVFVYYNPCMDLPCSMDSVDNFLVLFREHGKEQNLQPR
jgi:hypothetical protein